MALIGKIRKHSVLAMVLIGGALLAFILGDLGNGNGRQKKYVNIGIVDGERISTNDFNSEVDKITEIRSYNTDQKTLADMSYSIRESVWNDMVREALLGREYKKLDVNVTSEEMNDLIRGPQPHNYIKSFPYFTNQQTGAVDYEYINNFLQNLNNPQVVPSQMKNYYLYIESMIKKDAGETKYNNMISKSCYVPKAFVAKDYNEKNTNYDVALVAYKYKDLPDSMFNASKAELSKYYNDHKEEFKSTESRNLAYVELDIVPTPEDRENIINDVNALYEEFKAVDNIAPFLASESDTPFDTTWKKESDFNATLASSIFASTPGTFITPYQENETMYFAKILNLQHRPDSLKASHILISYNGAYNAEQTVTRSKEEANAIADSLAAAIRKSPESFTVVANQYSDDHSVKENNGEIGWFNDGDMVYPFNQFVVDNKVGTIGVVETVFGYHVINVQDKTVALPKAQVAIFSRAIVPSNKTYQDEYMNFSAFAANCKSFEDLMLAASDKGYNIKYFDNATRMSQGLNNIPNSREAIRWAFEDNVETNQVSTVYDLSDKLIVVAVTKINPEGYLSIDEVIDRITPMVLRTKKAEYAGKEMAQIMQGCTSLSQLANKMNVSIDSAIVNCNISNLARYGVETEVIGAMFASPENQMIGPINGEQASYVFYKTLKNAPEALEDYELDKNRMESVMSTRINRLAVKTMQDNAKIEDHRYLFY